MGGFVYQRYARADDVLHGGDQRRIRVSDCGRVVVYARRRYERVFAQPYFLYRNHARNFAYAYENNVHE